MIDHSATLAAVPFRLEGFKPTARSLTASSRWIN
jgi:hypothetical protein